MYPPFPIPGFAPNFTGYDFDNLNMDWNEVYKVMAQSPRTTVVGVSFNGQSLETNNFISGECWISCQRAENPLWLS